MINSKIIGLLDQYLIHLVDKLNYINIQSYEGASKSREKERDTINSILSEYNRINNLSDTLDSRYSQKRLEFNNFLRKEFKIKSDTYDGVISELTYIIRDIKIDDILK